MSENADNLHHTFYSRATAGEYGVSGGRNEKCAEITQKCGDDYCLVGAISARNSADLIVVKFLKSKDRGRTMK